VSELPTGTVTFLFTDIEGSTQLLQRLGPRYGEVLADHRTIMRDAFERCNGREVDTQGDAFFVVFERAADALSCAVDIQRALAEHSWPDGVQIKVRMGLHTGEPFAQGGGYVGLDVHRAARICASGHGGQILLSQSTVDLTEANLPAGAASWDLGEHFLKDLQRPEHIYQLVVPGLPTDFPTLKTLDRQRYRLPMQATPLLGRQRELADAGEYLRNGVRALTLTGPGGIGKTRLSVQIAAEQAESYADGACFVSLSSIRDVGLVMTTVAQALGLPESVGRTPLDALRSYLADRQMLLVLDNFEQVIEAAAQVAELLAGSARVQVLITSREALRIRGEQELPVPPLAVPAQRAARTKGDRIKLAQLVQNPSVALFIGRSRAVKPEFGFTAANAMAVAEICRQLDGLPLAIELAAARVKLLTPQAMLPRLTNRLALLTGGARDLPDRQQTLRSTIDWSYDLLIGDEQALFRRLAVFAGGCTLEAAEVVWGLSRDILDGLGSLVDKSLLRRQDSDEGEPRFAMLETIRECGLEHLETSGEAERVRRAHAEYFLQLAQAAEPNLTGERQREWIERLEREHDNLRVALTWAQQSGENGLGLALSAAVWRFWYTHGYIREGRSWLEQFLKQTVTGENARTTVRAQALCGAATLASTQDDLVGATSLAEESLALSRELADDGGIANALIILGSLALHQGEAIRAQQLFEEALALNRSLNDPWAIGRTLSFLGQSAYLQADFARAEALFQESLALLREQQSTSHRAINLLYLGHVAREQAAFDRAFAYYRDALTFSSGFGDKMRIARGLEAIATVVWTQGKAERALRLLAAAAGLRDELSSSLHPLERPTIDRTIEALRLMLDEATFGQIWEDGQAVPLEQVIQEALDSGIKDTLSATGTNGRTPA
jgi:predicted ATPase/class 3 adenylate cyclase